MKAKNQRLSLALVAVIALVGAGLLAARGLKEEASYYYTPAALAANQPDPGKAIRLGGMVERGSIERAEDGVTVKFAVVDGVARQAVRYTGITPNLFVEGSGVTADGRMTADGVFVADELLAKHDENYVPREMEHIDMSGGPVKTDTLVNGVKGVKAE